MYGKPERRLYVVETSDGLIKGGIARGTAKERIAQHRRALGTIFIRAHIASVAVSGIEAEVAFLRQLGVAGALARGREWFRGVSFERAAAIADQVSSGFPHAGDADSSLLRKARAAVNFNDVEIAILDAYCAKYGLQRAAACRRLFLEAESKLHEKNFAPSVT